MRQGMASVPDAGSRTTAGTLKGYHGPHALHYFSTAPSAGGPDAWWLPSFRLAANPPNPQQGALCTPCATYGFFTVLIQQCTYVHSVTKPPA